MSFLQGVLVRLRTGSAKYAGTDDRVYVGISGNAGGREFPLEVRWFNDLERLSEVKYALGEVVEEGALAGAHRPALSDKDWNDPRLFYVGFEGIDRVYLRKQARASGARDDAWQMDEVEIALFGSQGERRSFFSNTAIWLGVQYGLQVWIPERER